MITKHHLKLDCGVTAEIVLNDETEEMERCWTLNPNLSKRRQRDEIKKHYVPWRDKILADWSEKTGIDIEVVNA